MRTLITAFILLYLYNEKVRSQDDSGEELIKRLGQNNVTTTSSFCSSVAVIDDSDETCCTLQDLWAWSKEGSWLLDLKKEYRLEKIIVYGNGLPFSLHLSNTSSITGSPFYTQASQHPGKLNSTILIPDMLVRYIQIKGKSFTICEVKVFESAEQTTMQASTTTSKMLTITTTLMPTDTSEAATSMPSMTKVARMTLRSITTKTVIKAAVNNTVPKLKDPITSEFTRPLSPETDKITSSIQPVSSAQLDKNIQPVTVAQVGIQPEIAIQTGCEFDKWDITVNFGVLKLLYSNITEDSIYLGISSCVGRSHSDLLLFQQRFNSCSTTVTKTNASVVYQNSLIYAEHDPTYTFIVRRLIWDLPVKCQVPRVLVTNASIHHDGHHLHESIVTPPPGHTPITLQFFSDKNFLNPITKSSLHVSVGDLVYVKVLAVTQNINERLVLRSCFMIPSADAPDTQKYYIIRNGCITDANTNVISRSQYETRLSFREFEYASNHEGLKIYCEATFCDVNDNSPSCVINCATNNNPAIIG